MIERPKILLKVGEALDSNARSGIHRVSIQLARSLPAHAETQLVRWDRLAGHLRPLDVLEFQNLLGPLDWPVGLLPNPASRSVSYRFDDLINCSGNVCLIDPELSFHSQDGVEILARTITQCREYGVRTASVLYDLIPATNPAYRAYEPGFLGYLNETMRSDILLPISQHVAKEISRFCGTNNLPTHPNVSPVPLATDGAFTGSKIIPAQERRKIILVLGTVEPRKRQVEILRAFSNCRTQSKALSEFDLFFIGSLHPDVAKSFGRLLSKTSRAHYLKYQSDSQVYALLREAAFSIFASDDEGFGLPIVESLAVGTPCICANFGAMAEAADGGGCLTVNVRSQADLEAAIHLVANDVVLRDKLQREIACRPKRSWDDYARDVVEVISKLQTHSSGARVSSTLKLTDIDCNRREDLLRLSSADIVVSPSDALRNRAIEAASTANIPTLLPSRWVVGDGVAVDRKAKKLAVELDAFRDRLERVRDSEMRYAKLRDVFGNRAQVRRVFLRIVITTYNRKAFVIQNIIWLLAQLKSTPDVELVVVDNASTDGSVEAIERSFKNKVRIVCNPTNVGMLGNMRVCSQLYGAEYVWMIGDDDFIVPGQIKNTLNELKKHAGISLACVNFAVYYRESLRQGDDGRVFISEQAPLAQKVIPSGVYPMRVLAAQHDNLFTAMYAIIWRQDVFSAAYDHPFDGVPFSNLIESIPCTKTILETFSSADGLWSSSVGIVGNAHNSWVRHRPRWHGRLMAEAISIARDAGVDPERLWPWASLQADLYEDAFKIAQDSGAKINMDEPDAYDLSWPLYRRRLSRADSP